MLRWSQKCILCVSLVLNKLSAVFIHDHILFTLSCIPLSLACLHTGQDVVSDLNMGQLAAPEFTESRKLRGLSSFFIRGKQDGCLCSTQEFFALILHSPPFPQ